MYKLNKFKDQLVLNELMRMTVKETLLSVIEGLYDAHLWQFPASSEDVLLGLKVKTKPSERSTRYSVDGMQASLYNYHE